MPFEEMCSAEARNQFFYKVIIKHIYSILVPLEK